MNDLETKNRTLSVNLAQREADFKQKLAGVEVRARSCCSGVGGCTWAQRSDWGRLQQAEAGGRGGVGTPWLLAHAAAPDLLLRLAPTSTSPSCTAPPSTLQVDLSKAKQAAEAERAAREVRGGASGCRAGPCTEGSPLHGMVSCRCGPAVSAPLPSCAGRQLSLWSLSQIPCIHRTPTRALVCARRRTRPPPWPSCRA